MRVAVVGHVEWVEFVRVGTVPLPGQIAHALETWEEPGGGGAVAAALHHCRTARVLVATARELPTIQEAGVELDALVGSGEDEGELYHPGDLVPPPRLAVTTAGGLGGWLQPGGPFRPAPLPGQVVDTYGAGDSFAAGLTFALARGDAVEDAVALAARCGAAVMTGRGPYSGQLGAEAITP